MRLIDADALLKEIEDWHDSLGGTMNPADWGIQNVLQSVMDNIIETPDIDAEPVRHGYWTEDGCCSECGEMGLYNGNEEIVRSCYCPHCGEKLDDETCMEILLQHADVVITLKDGGDPHD